MIDLESKLVCYSHKLTPASFSWLREGVHQISILVTGEHSITVRTQIQNPSDATRDQVAYSSHRFLLLWLVSLNVGTFAHFGILESTLGNHDFSVIGTKILFQSKVEFSHDLTFPQAKEILDKETLKKSELAFIALAGETDSLILDEYTKGLYFLGSHLYGINFQKESFSKFYRLFEFFITRRVLKKTKLSNEVKDIEEALKKIGIPNSIFEMFRTELYPTRSAQVMHAWQDQVDIDVEITLKMKLLCDAVMYKAYEPEWHQAIENPKHTTEHHPGKYS